MVATDTLLEKWTIEFKKGFSKPLILFLLKNRDNYPYQITKEISNYTNGAINIKGSNIYPILSQMKKSGLVSSEKKQAEDSERMRTVYTLTSKGEEYLEALSKEITDFLEIMLSLIQEGLNNAKQN